MRDEKKAALAAGFSTTTPPVYFSSSALSNSIEKAIIGQQQADEFIRELRTDYTLPDALFSRVQEMISSAARLRGFCRTLEKFIERVEQ